METEHCHTQSKLSPAPPTLLTKCSFLIFLGVGTTGGPSQQSELSGASVFHSRSFSLPGGWSPHTGAGGNSASGSLGESLRIKTSPRSSLFPRR